MYMGIFPLRELKGRCSTGKLLLKREIIKQVAYNKHTHTELAKRNTGKRGERDLRKNDNYQS